MSSAPKLVFPRSIFLSPVMRLPHMLHMHAVKAVSIRILAHRSAWFVRWLFWSNTWHSVWARTGPHSVAIKRISTSFLAKATVLPSIVVALSDNWQQRWRTKFHTSVFSTRLAWILSFSRPASNFEGYLALESCLFQDCVLLLLPINTVSFSLSILDLCREAKWNCR